MGGRGPWQTGCVLLCVYVREGAPILVCIAKPTRKGLLKNPKGYSSNDTYFSLPLFLVVKSKVIFLKMISISLGMYRSMHSRSLQAMVM